MENKESQDVYKTMNDCKRMKGKRELENMEELNEFKEKINISLDEKDSLDYSFINNCTEINISNDWNESIIGKRNTSKEIQRSMKPDNDDLINKQHDSIETSRKGSFSLYNNITNSLSKIKTIMRRENENELDPTTNYEIDKDNIFRQNKLRELMENNADPENSQMDYLENNIHTNIKESRINQNNVDDISFSINSDKIQSKDHDTNSYIPDMECNDKQPYEMKRIVSNKSKDWNDEGDLDLSMNLSETFKKEFSFYSDAKADGFNNEFSMNDVEMNVSTVSKFSNLSESNMNDFISLSTFSFRGGNSIPSYDENSQIININASNSKLLEKDHFELQERKKESSGEKNFVENENVKTDPDKLLQDSIFKNSFFEQGEIKLNYGNGVEEEDENKKRNTFADYVYEMKSEIKREDENMMDSITNQSMVGSIRIMNESQLSNISYITKREHIDDMILKESRTNKNTNDVKPKCGEKNKIGSDGSWEHNEKGLIMRRKSSTSSIDFSNNIFKSFNKETELEDSRKEHQPARQETSTISSSKTKKEVHMEDRKEPCNPFNGDVKYAVPWECEQRNKCQTDNVVQKENETSICNMSINNFESLNSSFVNKYINQNEESHLIDDKILEDSIFTKSICLNKESLFLSNDLLHDSNTNMISGIHETNDGNLSKEHLFNISHSHNETELSIEEEPETDINNTNIEKNVLSKSRKEIEKRLSHSKIDLSCSDKNMELHKETLLKNTMKVQKEYTNLERRRSLTSNMQCLASSNEHLLTDEDILNSKRSFTNKINHCSSGFSNEHNSVPNPLVKITTTTNISDIQKSSSYITNPTNSNMIDNELERSTTSLNKRKSVLNTSLNNSQNASINNSVNRITPNQKNIKIIHSSTLIEKQRGEEKQSKGQNDLYKNPGIPFQTPDELTKQFNISMNHFIKDRKGKNEPTNLNDLNREDEKKKKEPTMNNSNDMGTIFKIESYIQKKQIEFNKKKENHSMDDQEKEENKMKSSVQDVGNNNNNIEVDEYKPTDVLNKSRNIINKYDMEENETNCDFEEDSYLSSNQIKLETEREKESVQDGSTRRSSNDMNNELINETYVLKNLSEEKIKYNNQEIKIDTVKRNTTLIDTIRSGRFRKDEHINRSDIQHKKINESINQSRNKAMENSLRNSYVQAKIDKSYVNCINDSTNNYIYNNVKPIEESRNESKEKSTKPNESIDFRYLINSNVSLIKGSTISMHEMLNMDIHNHSPVLFFDTLEQSNENYNMDTSKIQSIPSKDFQLPEKDGNTDNQQEQKEEHINKKAISMVSSINNKSTLGVSNTSSNTNKKNNNDINKTVNENIEPIKEHPQEKNYTSETVNEKESTSQNIYKEEMIKRCESNSKLNHSQLNKSLMRSLSKASNPNIYKTTGELDPKGKEETNKCHDSTQRRMMEGSLKGSVYNETNGTYEKRGSSVNTNEISNVQTEKIYDELEEDPPYFIMNTLVPHQENIDKSLHTNNLNQKRIYVKKEEIYDERKELSYPSKELSLSRTHSTYVHNKEPKEIQKSKTFVSLENPRIQLVEEGEEWSSCERTNDNPVSISMFTNANEQRAIEKKQVNHKNAPLSQIKQNTALNYSIEEKGRTNNQVRNEPLEEYKEEYREPYVELNMHEREFEGKRVDSVYYPDIDQRKNEPYDNNSMVQSKNRYMNQNTMHERQKLMSVSPEINRRKNIHAMNLKEPTREKTQEDFSNQFHQLNKKESLMNEYLYENEKHLRRENRKEREDEYSHYATEVPTENVYRNQRKDQWYEEEYSYHEKEKEYDKDFRIYESNRMHNIPHKDLESSYELNQRKRKASETYLEAQPGYTVDVYCNEDKRYYLEPETYEPDRIMNNAYNPQEKMNLPEKTLQRCYQTGYMIGSKEMEYPKEEYNLNETKQIYRIKNEQVPPIMNASIHSKLPIEEYYPPYKYEEEISQEIQRTQYEERSRKIEEKHTLPVHDYRYLNESENNEHYVHKKPVPYEFNAYQRGKTQYNPSSHTGKVENQQIHRAYTNKYYEIPKDKDNARDSTEETIYPEERVRRTRTQYRTEFEYEEKDSTVPKRNLQFENRSNTVVGFTEVPIELSGDDKEEKELFDKFIHINNLNTIELEKIKKNLNKQQLENTNGENSTLVLNKIMDVMLNIQNDIKDVKYKLIKQKKNKKEEEEEEEKKKDKGNKEDELTQYISKEKISKEQADQEIISNKIDRQPSSILKKKDTLSKNKLENYEKRNERDIQKSRKEMEVLQEIDEHNTCMMNEISNSKMNQSDFMYKQSTIGELYREDTKGTFYEGTYSHDLEKDQNLEESGNPNDLQNSLHLKLKNLNFERIDNSTISKSNRLYLFSKFFASLFYEDHTKLHNMIMFNIYNTEQKRQTHKVSFLTEEDYKKCFNMKYHNLLYYSFDCYNFYKMIKYKYKDSYKIYENSTICLYMHPNYETNLISSIFEQQNRKSEVHYVLNEKRILKTCNKYFLDKFLALIDKKFNIKNVVTLMDKIQYDFDKMNLYFFISQFNTMDKIFSDSHGFECNKKFFEKNCPSTRNYACFFKSIHQASLFYNSYVRKNNEESQKNDLFRFLIVALHKGTTFNYNRMSFHDFMNESEDMIYTYYNNFDSMSFDNGNNIILFNLSYAIPFYYIEYYIS